MMLALNQPFVTESLTRQAAQFDDSVQATAKQRADLRYGQIEVLRFSFKGLLRIDNLPGLSQLRELRLDNNQITKIENLSHLVSLTLLDLSFNKISTIESLDGLTNLQDLSLYHNQISVCENLEGLASLNCLSLGCNKIQDLRNIVYLRKLTGLAILTLVGNPIHANPSFQGLALAHLPHLKYLDNKALLKAEVEAARQRYQDTIAEFRAQDVQEAAVVAAAREEAANAAHMQAAHVEGVASILEDAVRGDVDWQTLEGVPDMLPGWQELQTLVEAGASNFQEDMVAQREGRDQEDATWWEATMKLVNASEQAAAAAITDFARRIKHELREGQVEGQVRPSHRLELIQANSELQDRLVADEMGMLENVLEMLQQFETAMEKKGETCGPIFAACFTSVRKQLADWWSSTSGAAEGVQQRYANGETDLDVLSEAARDVIRDKEAVMNLLSSCQERQWAHVDAVQSQLRAAVQDELTARVSEKRGWAEHRKRQRMNEIIHLCTGNNAILGGQETTN